MTEKTEPKRLAIKRMIEDGECTKDILKKELNISAASLATNFTYLRLMGHYPITNDDGFLDFTDAEGWEVLQEEKAERAATRKTVSKKTPQEQYDAIVKRVARAFAAANSAESRATDSPDNEMLDLRSQKAEIEHTIAVLEHNAIVEKFSEEIEIADEDDLEETTEETTEDATEESLV